LTKTEIENLEERINRLGESQEVSLSTEEANMVRSVWIHLHWTNEEAEEYENIRKREDVLLEHSKARNYTRIPGEEEEWTKLSNRSTELAHDIGMKRVIANHAMRDRIWPEFTRRVLRFIELSKKPTEQLLSQEKQELDTLLEWLGKVRDEAVETAKEKMKTT
jgi:hypothetical protein